MLPYTKGLWRYDWVKGHEMKRLSWVIQVDSHHRVSKRKAEGSQQAKAWCGGRAQSDVVAGLQSTSRRPLDDGKKARKRCSRGASSRKANLQTAQTWESKDWFWTFDLLQNCHKSVLFLATTFVAICYSGHRKLTLPQKGIGVSLQKEEGMKSGWKHSWPVSISPGAVLPFDKLRSLPSFHSLHLTVLTHSWLKTQESGQVGKRVGFC